MLTILSDHLHLPIETIETILAQPLAHGLASPEFNQIVGTLDRTQLKDSLPIVGTLLANHLPPFYEWLKTDLHLQRVPDSPNHTTQWVIGFLNHQESLERLVALHRPIPQAALEQAIPRLVGLFEAIEPLSLRQEWQRAIAALCLILVIAAQNPSST